MKYIFIALVLTSCGTKVEFARTETNKKQATTCVVVPATGIVVIQDGEIIR